MTANSRFFRTSDAEPGALSTETVAVVGYGNLGRSVALNLRDSGVDVVVGNTDDEYRTRAESEGFRTLSIQEAAAIASIVYVLVPDETMQEVFPNQIAPGLRDGNAVCFASGYALAFGLVEPPPGIDVLLVAPRMLGEEVRRTYLEGSGFFSYVSVEQDAGGRAEQRLLGIAAATGSLQKGAMELSARMEALVDLFIEQSVGPYIGAAIQTAFAVGCEGGIPEEALVLEMYMSGEMARTFQTFAEIGFFRSTSWHGAVAQYGGFLRTLDLDREEMERHFSSALDDIRSGNFARGFQEEQAAGYPTLDAIARLTAGEDPLTRAEDRARQSLARDSSAAPATD